MVDFLMSIFSGIAKAFKYFFNALSDKFGSFFASILLVISPLLIYIGGKLASRIAFVPLQFLFLGLIFFVRITTIAIAVNLSLWIYNQIHILLDYVNEDFLSNNILEWFLQLLRSISFFQAFNDTFATFSFLFVSILVLLVSKFFLKSMKLLSDEIWKLGMLLK
jgi:hypothetical protein